MSTIVYRVFVSVCAICGVLCISLPIPIIVNNFNKFYEKAKIEEEITAKKKKSAWDDSIKGKKHDFAATTAFPADPEVGADVSHKCVENGRRLSQQIPPHLKTNNNYSSGVNYNSGSGVKPSCEGSPGQVRAGINANISLSINSVPLTTTANQEHGLGLRKF